MTVSWLIADLKTGVVIDELPLTISNQIERTVGAAMTTSCTLALADPACPSNWNSLLVGGRTMVVLLDDDQPLVGYTLTTGEVGDDVVPISLTTLEGVLEADFCPDYDAFDVDESQILAALAAGVVAEFGLTLQVTDCGKKSDRTYTATEDRTVLSAAAELMTGGGLEWIIRVVWNADRTRFDKVLQIGAQVGHVIESTVFANEHVFRRKRVRDWRPGKFANHVQAAGEGTGDSRPMSGVYEDTTAIALGTPRWKARVTSSTADDDLETFAAAGLERRRYGGQTWELELMAKSASCPRIGRDWDAGDTPTMRLDPLYLGGGQVPAFLGFGEGPFGDGAFGDTDLVGDPPKIKDPASWYGPARLIGWRAGVQGRQLTSVTPVFWPEESE